MANFSLLQIHLYLHILTSSLWSLDFQIYTSELENQPEFNGFREWLLPFDLYRGKKTGDEEEDENRVVGTFKVSEKLYVLSDLTKETRRTIYLGTYLKDELDTKLYINQVKFVHLHNKAEFTLVEVTLIITYYLIIPIKKKINVSASLVGGLDF